MNRNEYKAEAERLLAMAKSDLDLLINKTKPGTPGLPEASISMTLGVINSTVAIADVYARLANEPYEPTAKRVDYGPN